MTNGSFTGVAVTCVGVGGVRTTDLIEAGTQGDDLGDWHDRVRGLDRSGRLLPLDDFGIGCIPPTLVAVLADVVDFTATRGLS